MPEPLNPPMPWDIWCAAAKQADVHESLVSLWSNLADEIAKRPDAICQASGRCCRFEEFGHRLYVTGLEIAWVMEQVRQMPTNSPDRLSLGIGAWNGRCPFQIDGRCSIHRIRPLGCRIFFCNKTTDAWQHDLYEKYQAAIRKIHDDRQLPYAYMEWRYGLSEASVYLR